MTTGLCILAGVVNTPILADIEDLFEIGLIIVLVLASVIASIVQKAKEASQQRKKQAGNRQQGQQPPPPRKRQARQEGSTLDLAESVRRRTAQQQQQARRRRKTPAKPAPQQYHQRPKTVKEYVKKGAGSTRMPQARGLMKPVKKTRRKTYLITPSDARQAVVYHEILSAPKATRKAPEMWEM